MLAYALFLACLAVYARRHPDVLSLTDALRLAPDILRLVRRLAADRALPRRSRLLLLGLLAYLLLPIDLVPDVLPVVGYADDLVLIAVVLRAVVRSAGPETSSTSSRSISTRTATSPPGAGPRAAPPPPNRSSNGEPPPPPKNASKMSSKP